MVRVSKEELGRLRKRFGNISSIATKHHTYVEPRKDILSWIANTRRHSVKENT